MLNHPKRILWPTDLSQLSLRAGLYAAGLCELFKADLHVLHVIPPPLNPDATLLVSGEIPLPVGEQEMRTMAHQSLTRIVGERLNLSRPAVTDVRFGSPWPLICNYAKEHGVELIVVSTHGRTGLGHAIIGSTAERIVQHAPCPVLVVKAQEQGFLAQ